MKKIDRTGEVHYNNFGSKVIITEYIDCHRVKVFFTEYNWESDYLEYKHIKKGIMKCPYEPRVWGTGYIGEGEYKCSENNKITKAYNTWNHMLRRCYSNDFQNNNSTYIGCKVCDEWLCFQNFAKWFEENYYEVDGELMDLDKDIKIEGNKIYSPETCMFIPKEINVVFSHKTKTNHIPRLNEKYKNKIPKELYDSILNYIN